MNLIVIIRFMRKSLSIASTKLPSGCLTLALGLEVVDSNPNMDFSFFCHPYTSCGKHFTLLIFITLAGSNPPAGMIKCYTLNFV